MKYKGLLGVDLSGSMAGVTASKNKSGGYFRSRIRSVQPNSVAQLVAKSNFGKAAGIFRALTGINKALWNGFAQGIFSPKNSTNSGQYSGQQAYQALAVSYNNAISSHADFTLKVNDVAPAGGVTFVEYSGPQDVAPTLAVNANLMLRPSGTIAVSLASAVVKADGNFSFKANVGDGSGYNIDTFVNASGADIGYAVFMSNGNPTANMNFKSKERYKLGYFDHAVATVIADLDSAVTFEMTGTTAFPIANYKTFPGQGETVLVSVYAVDPNNQMSIVGSIETTIIAA